MKEDTPNIGAVCQRLAKHAPSGLSAEQIAYRLGRPYNTDVYKRQILLFQHNLDALAQFSCFAGIASGVGPAHLPQFADGIFEPGRDLLTPHGLPLERFDPVAPLVTRILAATPIDAPPEYLRVLEAVEVVQKVADGLPDGFCGV